MCHMHRLGTIGFTGGSIPKHEFVKQLWTTTGFHCLTMKTAEIHFQEHSEGSNEFVGFNGWVRMVRLYTSNCGFGIVPNRHFGHAKQTKSNSAGSLRAFAP